MFSRADVAFGEGYWLVKRLNEFNFWELRINFKMMIKKREWGKYENKTFEYPKFNHWKTK